MAEIKVDTSHQQSLLILEDNSNSNQTPPKPKRVASLDIFRGLTVAVHSISLSAVEFICLQVSNFILG